ncbi:4-hydroxythreonine-4-phosphate dehydrogenase PdxA [Aurantimonas sp. C2-5-R2]|uniref:4-hydroxythreonine-4-phosphate dehydrogenase PdxA n=1 Tax=Aurantimonas sp. C2-5-R2 TaxID=3113713 RepID=UPI002F94B0BB
MGDAAGVGPEIVVKALESMEIRQQCHPIVIGDRRIMEAAVKRFGSSQQRIHAVQDVGEARWHDNTVEVLDLSNLSPADFELGKISAACGEAFVTYIRTSARLALEGRIDAIASAPTNKEAMHAAGHHYPGQTEIFAEETGSTDFFTVLTGGKMRVFLLSSHVSLRRAIEMVTQERVERVIRRTQQSLHDLWGIDQPKIAVAGLNPHAGDGGLFGQEEIEHVIPVIERLRAEGFDITGPGSADSLYNQADQGVFDGIVGMYHDQGVIPLKRYGYVTVIAGTPIIRTTAGHGTAYDIAGKGIASPAVMERAILLAGELAGRRSGAARSYANGL